MQDRFVTVVAKNSLLLCIAGICGAIFNVMMIPMGWMLGSLILVTALQMNNKLSRLIVRKPLVSIWKHIAQVIVAIQAGKEVSVSSMEHLQKAWLGTLLFLFLSLVISTFIGLLFSKTTQTDKLTGLFSTTPGGVSALPGVAEDLGADPVIVGTIQIIRSFSVIIAIPAIVSMYVSKNPVYQSSSLKWVEPIYETRLFDCFEWMQQSPVVWTVLLVFSGTLGFLFLRKVHVPSALLIGTLLGVSFLQFFSSEYYGKSLMPWFPSWMDITAQVLLGASLGISFSKDKWVKLRGILYPGIISVLLLLISGLNIAILVHLILHIPLATAILSFAPGGVAIMTAVSLSLHADTSYVLAVQILRLMLIYIFLPPLFNQLHQKINV